MPITFKELKQKHDDKNKIEFPQEVLASIDKRIEESFDGNIARATITSVEADALFIGANVVQFNKERSTKALELLEEMYRKAGWKLDFRATTVPYASHLGEGRHYTYILYFTGIHESKPRSVPPDFVDPRGGMDAVQKDSGRIDPGFKWR